MANLISSKGGVKPSMQKSAKVHMAAGSGSRPVPSKMKIDTSAPADAKSLGGRMTKNALK